MKGRVEGFVDSAERPRVLVLAALGGVLVRRQDLRKSFENPKVKT